MNPEGVDSETISIIDRALEQFRAGQVESPQNEETRRFANMFFSSLVTGAFGEPMDMPSSRRPSQEEPQISTGASQTRNTNIADEVISITSGTNTPASSTTNIDEEEELNNEEQYSFSPIPIFSIPTSPTNYTGSPFTIGSIPSSPTNGMGSPTIIGLSPPTGASSPSEAHSPVVIPLYPASPPVTGSPITSNPAFPLAFDTGFPIDFISHLRSPSPYSFISIPRSPVYNPNSPVYYPNSPEQYTNQETEQNENPGGDNVHNTSTNFDRDAGRLGSMTETTIPESDKESVYDVPEIDLPTDFIDLATDEEEVYELASDDDVNEVAIQQLIEDNVEETFYEIEPVESVENSILDGQEETTFEEALEDGVEDENDAIIEQSSANESQAASDEDNEVFYDADDSAFIELADRVENDLKKKQRQVEPGSLLPVLIEPTTLSKRKRDSDDEGSQDVFNKVHRSQISNSSRSTLDEVPFIEIPSPSAMNTNRQADEPTSSEIRAIYGISDDKPISLPSIYSLEPEDDNMDLGQPEAEKPTDTGFSVIDESRLLQEDIVDQVAIQAGHSTIFTQKQVDLIPSFHDDTQVPLIDWRDEEAKLAMICLQPTNCSVPQFRLIPDSTTSLLEQNRTLRLWWYDAYERHDNGSVYLFGKVYNKSLNKYDSCCVTVQNITRELYFLPRTYRLNDNGQSTRSKVEMEDVRQEVKQILQRKGIENYTMNACRRKYAFELPDVPAEAAYLKLNYSFKGYELESSIIGKTFSHVFGCSTGPLEHFIINNDVMGPCWLELKNVSPVESNMSWCNFNIEISKPEDCSVLKDSNAKSPPLTILSLNLQTKMNYRENTNEIVAASMFFSKDVKIEEQDSVSSIQGSRYTLVRPLHNASYPSDIEAAVDKEKNENNHHINTAISEYELLQALLATIHTIDPDVIVGHNFLNVTLDILLHRMKTLNVTHWHKLGRLKAYRWPKLHPGSGGSGVITYQERLFMTGRLVCDTHIASKDLVSSKSYHLSKLVSFQLNILREDIQTSALCRYFSDNAGIIQLAKHCSFDAFLSYALMVKLQILPLTKQLTNLSGNLWSRSMHGARSERNEYLLLHNFYKHQFICPDKGGFKGKRDLQFVDEDLELEMPAKKKQKGPNGKAEASYSGGLVLEPKTGFYDKYVLLLDFNSLYPSIMQEYNVCFTSMGGQPDNGITLNTPSSQKPIGILPELVKTFVQQRQRIKRLMADPNLSKSTKAQYNIEQMALKLTANSMYGCLGSSISRFYAKPLAMFITAKGREILQATADLATHSGLDVIYGDTDSVMINTNQVNMANAKSIGETFKQRVNQNYKQLEIEIDGFFRHTLLLRKKKYAALLVKEKPNGSLQESIEVKGLDLVRRDWCDLSHGVSEDVLKYILSDSSRKNVVDQIHSYLRSVAQCLRDLEYPIEDFIILKQLTKSPELYDNSKANPHVIVAKDMRRAGLAVKAGDTIPYIVCKSEELDDVFNVPRMPDDVRNGKAQIDLQWYLSKQILPPVARLCNPIDGTDLEKLTECLGLDIAMLSERNNLNKETEVQETVNDDPDLHLLLDERRFSTMERLVLKCSNCTAISEFQGPIQRTDDGRNVCGLMCKRCGVIQNSASVQTQIRIAIADFIQKYYDSLYQCNEPSCGYHTRDMIGQCPNPTCNGHLLRDFSDKKMYSQLSYYSSLFDIKIAKEQALVEEDDTDIVEIIDNYEATFDLIKNDIEEYVNKCDYKFLNISTILMDITNN